MMEIRRTVMSIPHPEEPEDHPERLGEVIVTDRDIELRWGGPPGTVLFKAPLEVWAFLQLTVESPHPQVDKVEYKVNGEVVWRGHWMPAPEAGAMSTSDGLGS